MSNFVVCECCGDRHPVTPSDVGRAVVCPRSRRLVLVSAGDVRPAVEPGSGGRGRWAVAVLLLLLLAGGGAMAWRWNKGRTPPVVAAPAAGGAAVAAVEVPTGGTGTKDTTVVAVVPPGSPAADPPAAGAVVTPAVPVPAATASLPRTIPAGLVTEPVTPGLASLTPAPTSVVPVPGTPTTDATPPGPAARPDAGAAVATDARGFPVHRLARRIDLRTAEELQKELLTVREVTLDTPAAPKTAAGLVALARTNLTSGGTFAGPALAARNRPDLAGLPLRLGAESVLFRDRAEALDARSRQLRAAVGACVRDGRPDPDLLFAKLQGDAAGLFRDRRWATAEAVPCVQQMLQAEGKDVRRMSVELLRGIDGAAATEVLARWAVFDTDADNRAAAVDALKSRDRPLVVTVLLAAVRHPWPRGAEHAAEALVALDAREAAPDLAALLPLADPDAPAALDGVFGGVLGSGRFRREMVRVNHARNCLLCHPPSFRAGDLVRGAIPDPARELPPVSTPAYYTGEADRVAVSAAAGTYLRQDFSVVQPVPDPGPWPTLQRYDYLVSVRRVKDADLAPADGPSPFRAAVLFALRELTGSDRGGAPADWAAVRGDKAAPPDSLPDEAARLAALTANPLALLTLAWSEFGQTLLDLGPAERRVVVARFRSRFGAAGPVSLVAYLGPLARSSDPAVREKAAALLAALGPAAGDSADLDAADLEVAARLLNHPAPHVRAAAAAALRRGGAKAHYKLLMAALKDADADVRVEAAGALGSVGVGPDELYDALAAATEDRASRVRTAAASALAELKTLPRSAAKGIAGGIARPGEWESADARTAFQTAAAALLLDLGPRAAGGYDEVLGAADKADVPAALAVKLLTAIGPAPADAGRLARLVALLPKRDFRAIAESHLEAAGDEAVGPLLTGLRSADEAARVAAAEVLGKVASVNHDPRLSRESWTKAMDALAATKATDRSPAVQTAAANALNKLTVRP